MQALLFTTSREWRSLCEKSRLSSAIRSAPSRCPLSSPVFTLTLKTSSSKCQQSLSDGACPNFQLESTSGIISRRTLCKKEISSEVKSGSRPLLNTVWCINWQARITHSQGGGGPPRNSWWGCAARFSKP